MAIKEIKREWSPCQLDYVKTFLLHSEKELKDLPKCCIGSKAIVSETDNEYFCTESGWKLGSELGGGGEVVILPETVVTVNEAQGFITTPLSATPTDGATAEITYNGTKYTSSIVYASDDGIDMYAMGNLTDVGIPGGGNPDAPFMVALFPNGMDGAYGIVMTMQEVTTVTLSIVQTGGAASGGESAGGGVSGDYILIIDENKTTTQKWSELSAAVLSGRGVRMEQRVVSESGVGCVVLLMIMYGTQNNAVGQVLFYTPGIMFNSHGRYVASPGENNSIIITEQSSD